MMITMMIIIIIERIRGLHTHVPGRGGIAAIDEQNLHKTIFIPIFSQ